MQIDCLVLGHFRLNFDCNRLMAPPLLASICKTMTPYILLSVRIFFVPVGQMVPSRKYRTPFFKIPSENECFLTLSKNKEHRQSELFDNKAILILQIETIGTVVIINRLLINSSFGVFYSYFWAGDSCFSKNLFKFTLWDSYFF